MEASPDFWTSAVNYWNTLREGTRDNAIGGLMVAVVLGLLAIFRNALRAAVGRFFRRAPEQLQSPTTHEVVIKVETPQLVPVPPPPQPSSDSTHQYSVPPELASLIPRPPVVGFVSRRDEQGRDIVERLTEELAPGRNQLVTLSGAGGLGKTTLGAEAARGLQAVYDGRVTWSSADGRPDFSLLSLLDDIATQLGHAELRTLAPAEKEEQVRALTASALVVLDNYETVAEAERARVEAWFKSARCSALLTSRLPVDETRLVRVSAMSREEAEEFLERLTAEQTLEPQVFTADVRRRVYETAEANPHVMQWVVRQIDRARVPDTVFEELAGGAGAAAERVFARSFNLPQLGEDGRDALLALSLFAPSASREALAQVAGFGDDWAKRLGEAVKNLHALWLVKGVDGNRRLAVEGLTRTLAAARRLKDPRGDEFRLRFVAYFLRYALERDEPTPENYDALEAETDNLLGAADAAFTSGNRGDIIRMAFILARFDAGMLGVRGYWDGAVRLCEQALQTAHSLQDEAKVAGLSHNLAVLYGKRGKVDEERRLYSESLEISRRLGNQKNVAITLSQLAVLMQSRGDLDEALRLYNESLEIDKKRDDKKGVSNTLHNLATIEQRRGNLEEARRLYNESLEIVKKLDEPVGVVATLHQLGRLAEEERETEKARYLYNESLAIAKRLGYQEGVAFNLHQLGRLAEDEGDKKEAARLFRECLSIVEKFGSPLVETVRRSLARVEGEDS